MSTEPTRPKKTLVPDARTTSDRHQQHGHSPAQLLTSRTPEWRARLLIFIVGLCFCALVGRALYIISDPGMRLRALMLSTNTPQPGLIALVNESERLASVSKNMETLSIADLRSAISTSLSVAQRAATEFSAQSEDWAKLRGRIKEDSSSYDKLRQELALVQGLQKQEITRLKIALDEAQRPSIFADIWSLSLSFALGVLSSIVATALYERYRRNEK